MSTKKHLVLEDRFLIKSLLDEKKNFSQIAEILSKSRSTISREVRNHSICVRKGSRNHAYNACKNRFSCKKSHICMVCERGLNGTKRFRYCKNCSKCNDNCKDFVSQECLRLNKTPFVCNGCGYSFDCTLKKKYYYPDRADEMHRLLLSESRSGFSFDEADLQVINEVVSPLIKKGQSLHHICATNADRLNVSERTLYRLIDARALDAINFDLPRKVRFKKRRVSSHVKVDKKCRIGRTFDDYKAYLDEHPDIPITQLDSVEGVKGGKVLLTIHFVKAEFMLAFIRDHNDSRSVTDIFNYLYELLGYDIFSQIFKVCLADNGTEFSNPMAIEYNCNGLRRTRVFYCNPSAPYQKGSAERNHEFIRLFLPKSVDFSNRSQEDINLMMNHINSYTRESLGDKSPYEMFAFLYGSKALDLLGAKYILPQDVTLNKSIFQKEVL